MPALLPNRLAADAWLCAPWFFAAGWVLMSKAQQVAHSGERVRNVQLFLDHLLLDGKFYTLFSLLFGTNWTLPWAGCRRRAGASNWRGRRRAPCTHGA